LSHRRLWRAVVPALLLTGAFATPASAQDEHIAPVDLCAALAVTITFDEPTYAPETEATLTVALTNNSAEPLTGITTGSGGGQPDELVWDNTEWGELSNQGEGLSLAPGETKSVAGKGFVPATAADYGRVGLLAAFNTVTGDAACSPAFSAHARVPGKTGDLTGRITDADGTGVVDAILAAYTVDTASTCAAVTRSGADGNYVLSDLPAGSYVVALVPPPGWVSTDGYSKSGNVVGNSRPVDFALAPGESNIPHTPPNGCADDTPPTTTPPVTPPAPTNPAAPAPQGGAGVPARLADTGGAPTGLIPVGIGLLLAGGVAVAAARRMRATV